MRLVVGRNPDVRRISIMKFCRRCGHRKCFYVRRSPCKECISKTCAIYRKKPGIAKRRRALFKEYRRQPHVLERARLKARAAYLTPRGRETYINAQLRYRYGISGSEYRTILRKQRGRCATCRKKLRMKHFGNVDHCHKTNRVRGLLCRECNLVLGYVKDKSSTLQAMIHYLKRYQ